MYNFQDQLMTTILEILQYHMNMRHVIKMLLVRYLTIRASQSLTVCAQWMCLATLLVLLQW